MAKFSNEFFQKSFDKQNYFKIDEDPVTGELKIGRLVITGAERRWKERPDYVYVREYRLVGPVSDIRRYMKEDPYFRDVDIEAVLQRSYISQNYFLPGIRDVFEDEKRQYHIFRQQR